MLLDFTMPWLNTVLDELANAKAWTYHRGQDSAAEPAAFAAMALIASGRTDRAAQPLNWLLEQQAAAGTVGVTAAQDSPVWATALAVLAWQMAETSGSAIEFQPAIQRGCDALLRIQGATIPVSDVFGHDTSLVGWPWVDGTHSWIEPSAFAVLAFKATGQANQPRVREAVQLIRDRLLPEGGANYGNTFVLGQRLRPHVQPSGVALCAIANEPSDPDGRVQRTIDYLHHELSRETTTSSLSFALLGLGVANALPANAEDWLAAAAKRTLARDPSPYKMALLALASRASDCPLSPQRIAVAL